MKEPQPDRSPIPDMDEADQANGEKAEPPEGDADDDGAQGEPSTSRP